VSIKFRWLGTVCFEIVLPSGKVLIIDPYIDYSATAPIKCKNVTGADYIAITHGDIDHITDIGTLAKKFNSTIICSHQLAEPFVKAFDLDRCSIIKVTAGNTIVFEDLRVEVKKAEHVGTIEPVRWDYEKLTGKKPSPDLSLSQIQEEVRLIKNQRNIGYGSPEVTEMRNRLSSAGVIRGEMLNFIFQTSENLRLYIFSAGTYDFLRNVVSEAHSNVFFPQLAGVYAENVADFCILSGAEIIVPTHHDAFGVEGAHQLARELAMCLRKKSKAQVLDVEPGKWYELAVNASPVNEAGTKQKRKR
jgi:L-ascorbate metabolism protein UlaG (beta-lactamase superfamily)